MALDQLKNMLASNPHKAWQAANSKPAADKMPQHRKKVLEGITKTLAQIKSKAENPKFAWYKTANGVAKVQVKIGRKVVKIDGNDFNVVADNLMDDFYTLVTISVEAGELDDAIKAALGDNAAPVATIVRTRADAGKKRAGWSDERRARQAASIAKRNAAKAS